MEQIMAMRAQWFAQLADAIEGAQRVAWQLGKHSSASLEARELYGRLEAARIELDHLRGVASSRPIFDPQAFEALGWMRPFAEPLD